MVGLVLRYNGDLSRCCLRVHFLALSGAGRTVHSRVLRLVRAREIFHAKWHICRYAPGLGCVGGIQSFPGFSSAKVRSNCWSVGRLSFHAHHVRSSAGNWLQSRRSEEHTSELQSLMRISYAVFCLKKKKIKT